MNEKNIKALLKSLGISETVITESEKDDFDVKAAVATFNESQKAHYTDIITNEIRPQIEDELTTSINGKWLGSLDRDLKKHLGIPDEKIKGVPMHDKLKIAKAHLDEIYSKNPNAEETKKLQEELMETRNELTEWKGKLPLEVERIQKEEKQKTVLKLTDIELQKKLHSIPAEKFIGKTHAPGYYSGLKSELTSKYDFGLDENDSPVVYKKGTQTRATIKDASGKESFASLDELVLTSLDALGFIAKSNGGEGSGNSGKGGNGNGNGQEKSAHLKALEERAMKAVA